MTEAKLDRKHRNQRERRARKQEDHKRVAEVAACDDPEDYEEDEE